MNKITDQLKAAGLERCDHCQRILLTHHLENGKCTDRADCARAAMIAKAAAADEVDMEFIRGLE